MKDERIQVEGSIRASELGGRHERRWTCSQLPSVGGWGQGEKERKLIKVEVRKTIETARAHGVLGEMVSVDEIL